MPVLKKFKLFIMAVVDITSNEAKRVNSDIYDDFNARKPLDSWFKIIFRLKSLSINMDFKVGLCSVQVKMFDCSQWFSTRLA